MPRPKLQIVTDSVTFPKENVPVIHSDFFPPDPKHLQGHLCVYMWVSKKDVLPFFIGIGTREHAHLTIHRIPGTRKNTIQQIYREIVGPDFLCLIVSTSHSYFYALPLFKSIYTHYKNVSRESFSTNPPYDFTVETPFLDDYPPSMNPMEVKAYRDRSLQIMLNHSITNMFLPSSPESIGNVQARRHYELELATKLQKQTINDKTYIRYQEAREEARRKALGEKE